MNQRSMEDNILILQYKEYTTEYYTNALLHESDISQLS